MIKSYRRLIVLFCATSFATACYDFSADSRELTPLPLLVNSTGTAFYGEEGLRAPGPLTRVCVGLLDQYGVSRGKADNAATIIDLDGRMAAITVTLIRNDSTRVSIPFHAVETENSHRSACFEMQESRDTDRRYARGELTADNPIMIFGVRWSSGKQFDSWLSD
jgi:hypothetical protein